MSHHTAKSMQAGAMMNLQVAIVPLSRDQFNKTIVYKNNRMLLFHFIYNILRI